MSARPRYRTAHEGLPDESAAIADTARSWDLELMPWQAETLAVMTQHDGTAYRYPVCLVTVPRQCGKTTLLQALVLHRLRHGGPAGGDWECVITAATRQDAARFVLDWAQTAEHWEELAVRRGVGQESMTIGKNRLKPFAPQPEALHGQTLDAVLWDETWSIPADRAREIVQAAVPAMVTRADRQLIMVSTAGSPESSYLREWVLRGREGKDPDLCFIEYAAPAGADVDDVDSWRAWHPAYGRTIDARGVRQARSIFADDEAGFRRAYCNQWPDAAAVDVLIPPETWAAITDVEVPLPPADRVVIALDVDLGGLSASVCAAWSDPAGGYRVELVDHRPGTAWIQDRIPELLRTWRQTSAWAQDYGPVRPVLDSLELAGTHVSRIPSKDTAAATEQVLSMIRERSVRVTASDVLAQTASTIGVRPYGDTVQWARDAGHVSSPLTAATWALWGARRARPRARPRIVVSAAG